MLCSLIYHIEICRQFQWVTTCHYMETFRWLSKDILSWKEHNIIRLPRGYFASPKRAREKHYKVSFYTLFLVFLHWQLYKFSFGSCTNFLKRVDLSSLMHLRLLGPSSMSYGLMCMRNSCFHSIYEVYFGLPKSFSSIEITILDEDLSHSN